MSVMVVATIVSIIGFSAAMLARIKLREAQTTNDGYEARLLSMSAVEIGISAVNTDTAWRTTYLHDVENPPTPLTQGNGTLTWKLADTDGDLADNPSEAARLYGIGRVNGTVHVVSVLIAPATATEMRISPGSWQREPAP